MKCSSCGRYMPPEISICPYCGGKPENRSGRTGKAPAHAAETTVSLSNILLLVLALLVGLSALALTLYYSVILPRSNYKLACEALDRSEYRTAAQILADCSYKDSQSLYYYSAGMYRLSQEAWADAAEYFSLSEKPAPDGVYAYCLAMDAMDKGEWTDAAQLFSLTDGYSRSEEMRAVCLALAAREEGSLADAMELLPEGSKYEELSDAFSYSACYDLVFLETLSSTLEESFEYAASNPERVNASNALDGVYYAFYDIYTSNKDSFSSLFHDKKLASLASQYITASLRQWSLTSYSGSIIPGHEQEYFSLAAQRRALVNKIDKLYSLGLDRDAVKNFVSRSNVLRTFWYDYGLPLQQSVSAALENPDRHDGSYWITVSLDTVKELSEVFNLQLEFFDKDGNTVSAMSVEELSIVSGDSILVCLDGYGANVKSCRVSVTPVAVTAGGKPLLTAWDAI